MITEEKEKENEGESEEKMATEEEGEEDAEAAERERLAQEEKEREEKERKEREEEEARHREKVDIFVGMLRSKNISPFSSWKKELPRLCVDPRFSCLSSQVERQEVFEQYMRGLTCVFMCLCVYMLACVKKILIRMIFLETGQKDLVDLFFLFSSVTGRHAEIRREKKAKVPPPLLSTFFLVHFLSTPFSPIFSCIPSLLNLFFSSQSQSQADAFRAMMDEMGDKLNSRLTYEKFQEMCGSDERFRALTEEERRTLFAEKVMHIF